MTYNQKFNVYGMTCSNCASHVEKAVLKIKGVTRVAVNLVTNSMVVTKEQNVDDKDICNAVSSAGYKAKIFVNNQDKKEDDVETKKLKKILFFSFIFLIPLFYLSMGYMLSWPIGYLENNPTMLAFILFILAAAILVINKRFFVSGFRALVKLSPTMDSLVALGSGVSFLYSFALIFVIMFYSNNHNSYTASMYAMNLCFETSGMIPTLITIGKVLESYSKGKTVSSIKALMDLSPKQIHVLKHKKIIDINVEDALIGDRFIVKPGEVIPLDGKIISGESSIDEKILTGESIPVDKKANDLVYCGTINLVGSITCQVVKKSNDTVISQIVKLVEEASATKTKVSSIVDRVSFYFVPSIILIAIIVFAFWLGLGNNFVSSLNDPHTTLTYAIERAVSVLVISCPCALGLATPLSIMVGNGVGAKQGILFKNDSAMEICGLCRFVVLDKTGTITRGKPIVDQIIPLNNHKEDELIKIAYSLEEKSEHPLAIAITNYGNEKEVSSYKNVEVENIIGKGIKGKIDNKLYFAGNYLLLDENGIKYNKEKEIIDNLINDGKQVLIFFNKKEIIGLISLQDEIKDGSIEAIDNLKKQGLIPIIISGDNRKNVESIAKIVGVERYVAEILPNQKEEIIANLQKYGKVIFVGDGINDAPSLSKADASMALSSGSDIAIDSGNIVLINSSLLYVTYAVNLSRYTIRNIKENLFWAFIYNIIMIPIACGVFSFAGLNKLRPWMGSAAMALSSIIVCLNALRINIFDVRKIKEHHRRHLSLPLGALSFSKLEKKEKDFIYVPDMMCENCVDHVTNALKKLGGISDINISLETKKVEFVNKGVDINKIKNAIINIGYVVEENHNGKENIS